MRDKPRFIISTVMALAMAFAILSAPSSEAALVAVGDDVEMAHRIKDCDAWNKSPWGWTIQHTGTRWHGGYWYVIHEHHPKWYNVTGKWHVNVSQCKSGEYRVRYH